MVPDSTLGPNTFESSSTENTAYTIFSGRSHFFKVFTVADLAYRHQLGNFKAVEMKMMIWA